MILQQDIESYAVSSTGNSGHLSTEWTYDSSDPAAVQIVFKQNFPVKWIIARDLFVKGLSRPVSVGEGDVKLQTDGEWFRMFLDSTEDISACIRFIRSDVQEFIDETLEIVPLDTENQSVSEELDDALAMILSEGA